jgi:hypothetical protein
MLVEQHINYHSSEMQTNSHEPAENAILVNMLKIFVKVAFFNHG